MTINMLFVKQFLLLFTRIHVQTCMVHLKQHTETLYIINYNTEHILKCILLDAMQV